MVDALLGIAVFLLVITSIVVVHEGGHALAARLAGVRVTEFFVGMPWGPAATRLSGRSGILYGVTFALLGGYTRIAGMGGEPDGRLAEVLELVNRRGTLSVDDVCEALSCERAEAKSMLDMLCDWGSVEPCEPTRGGMRKAATDEYRTTVRDHAGLTVRDRRHDFESAPVHPAGEPYDPGQTAGQFLDGERARTYLGVSVPKRVLILVAGIALNIATAFIAAVVYLSLHGTATVPNAVVSVEPGSAAEAIGMVAGDEVVSIDGVAVGSYEEVGAALASVSNKGSVHIVYRHDGGLVEGDADLGEKGMLGVRYGIAQRQMGVGEAASEMASMIVETGVAIGGLLVPSKAPEVVENASGIVGIASMTTEVVRLGPWEVLFLWALLSLSLGWMNLLPLLPLDGGRIVIELVQAVIRRPVPQAVQAAITMAGIFLLLMLFVVVTTQDVGRIIGG